MKNENNELITDEKSFAEDFKTAFQEILDQPEIEDQGQDNVVYITVE